MLPGTRVSPSHRQQVFGALCHVRALSVLPALTSAPASPWDEGSWGPGPLTRWRHVPRRICPIAPTSL